MEKFVGRAQGATKKRAEQEAARQVLEHLTSQSQGQQPKASNDGAASS
jgi:dsRNA-specific ribonuclease